METQYFIIILIAIFLIFLISIWINKIIKLFLSNYIASFFVIISYLFTDFLIHYIEKPQIKLSNPDAIQWFLMNNQINIALLTYFIFLILFYKSTLFTTNIEGLLKKTIWIIIFPFLTVISFLFTIFLTLNWPDILKYQNYLNIIQKLNLNQFLLIEFFKLIPLIILVIPFIVLLFFIDIKISIKLPVLRKKKNIEEEEKQE